MNVRHEVGSLVSLNPHSRYNKPREVRYQIPVGKPSVVVSSYNGSFLTHTCEHRNPENPIHNAYSFVDLLPWG